MKLFKKLKHMNFRCKFRKKYGKIGDNIIDYYDDALYSNFETNLVVIKFTASKRAVLVPRYKNLKPTLANYIILNLIHKNDDKLFKWIKK